MQGTRNLRGEIAMRRYLGWAVLVAAGLLLGVVSSSYQGSSAALPATVASDDSVNAEMLAELKEIKTQLKEINSHLKTGTTRVFVNMNPPAQ
jgi:hypothetical protein